MGLNYEITVFGVPHFLISKVICFIIANRYQILAKLGNAEQYLLFDDLFISRLIVFSLISSPTQRISFNFTYLAIFLLV